MKTKTLLEAATNMLHNMDEPTLSESTVSQRELEDLDFLSLHKILDLAVNDTVGPKYNEAFMSNIDDLLNLIEDGEDTLYSVNRGKKLNTIPNIKNDEALKLTRAVLKEISNRCDSIIESMRLIASIKKLTDRILNDKSLAR